MTYNYEFCVQREQDWYDPEYIAARDAYVASRSDGLFGWMAQDDSPQPPKVDRWIVSLPHQCDSWEIAGRYGSGADHAEAVAALQEFIEQARAALLALIHRQEMVDGEIEIKIEGSA